MVYCKNCGAKLENIDSFCEKCGTKRIASTKNKTKDLTQDKHILPAILSFFFPGIGQFVKGQIKWGLSIWLGFILGNLLIIALSNVFLGFTIVLLIVFNLSFWIYQIYDAYNSPERD